LVRRNRDGDFPVDRSGRGHTRLCAEGFHGRHHSPIVEALLGKGAALGTVLAFMMNEPEILSW